MDGKGVPGSPLGLPEEQKESFDLSFFKVSCALYAIRLLTESKVFDANWSEISNGTLLGSAHLLGLLAGGVRKGEGVEIGKTKLLQRLENAQREIAELKKLRSEDAKGNEKVVSLYATHEQGWFSERKTLRQHIVALVNGLRVVETKKESCISELKEKLRQKEALLMSKEKLIEKEERMKHDLEDELRSAKIVIEELKESAKLEVQRHSDEIAKNKYAFIELVSNQRQLEAEISWAVSQVESAKEETDLILEQKEQAVLMTQKLSLELVKVRRDLEQKDRILSGMVRKSKLDTAEKQMLLEEMKSSKAKRKQAEMKTEKSKNDSECRNKKHSLRSMLSKHVNSKFDAFSGSKGLHSSASMASYMEPARSNQINFLIEFDQPEFLPGPDEYTSVGYQDATNFKYLDAWVQTQAENYQNTVERRHHLEVDAFAEQLRLKDEKLEALRWHLVSMELESKKMKAHVEGLDCDLVQLKQEKMKLEALLLNHEADKQFLAEKLASKVPITTTQKASIDTHSHDTTWSDIRIIKPGEEVQETSAVTEPIHQKVEKEKQDRHTRQKDTVLLLQSLERESEEEEDKAVSLENIQDSSTGSRDSEKAEASPSVKYITKVNNSPWRMDLHALGVSYKIKRLKQQLLMLEKLAGKQESPVGSEDTDNGEYHMKSFLALLSLLNRQISWYLSLQGKTDDLLQRMHENDPYLKQGNSNAAKSKKETRLLEHYLEETFQLQRYMVASGQKLTEIQAKISTGFSQVVNGLDMPATFDMKRFADSIRTLFRDVQRGLEVRMSRIIGDLEGTLACDGIIHLRK